MQASHADELKDHPPELLAQRCERMASAVHRLLEQHRVAQAKELALLAEVPAAAAGAAEVQRRQLLEEVLRRPLRLSYVLISPRRSLLPGLFFRLVGWGGLTVRYAVAQSGGRGGECGDHGGHGHAAATDAGCGVR